MTDEDWLPLGVVVEGQPLWVAGVSVWESTRWRSEGRRLVLLQGGEQRAVSAYALRDTEPPIRLALGEVSAGVYAVGVSPPDTAVER